MTHPILFRALPAIPALATEHHIIPVEKRTTLNALPVSDRLFPWLCGLKPNPWSNTINFVKHSNNMLNVLIIALPIPLQTVFTRTVFCDLTTKLDANVISKFVS